MLTPREIIAQAWAITTSAPEIKRWGFLGSTLRLLLDIKLVAYQIYFLMAYMAGKEVGLFDDFIWLHERVSLPVFIVITGSFGLLLLMELILPSFTDGAIIGLAAKAHQKQPLRGGFILALYNFFPIFTLHEFFVFSGVNLLITTISIMLRYGEGMTVFLVIISTILWLLSSLLKFFASFAEPAIVVSKTGVFASIGRSIKLVFSYPSHIIFLLLLLFIISVRIFINLAILIIIPGAALGVGIVLTYVITPAASYTIATILALLLVGAAGYFFTYFHVFKQTVWTIMYMELIKQKDFDTIE
jgi:hypothetical protein